MATGLGPATAALGRARGGAAVGSKMGQQIVCTMGRLDGEGVGLQDGAPGWQGEANEAAGRLGSGAAG